MRNFLVALILFATPLAVIPVFSTLTTAAAATVSELGDLSSLSAIANDTLVAIKSGDLVAAQHRITDFETAWDDATGTMQPLSPSKWHAVDVAADRAIEAVRASNPNRQDIETALGTLISELDNPSAFAVTPTGPVAVADAGGGLVIVNADGSPLPCEVALKALRDTAATEIPSDQASYDGLMNKGLERCNADDDKRADGFFAGAFALLQ